ncbi:hypothetical protein JCM24511_07590 [Saitozyma sp. JCM 24511]|nr:hypothetical protein JCM24511_07590 [Saitozyma sp. JCM 24511]
MDSAELLRELEEDRQVVRDSDERCLALAAQAEAAARYAAQHLDERPQIVKDLSTASFHDVWQRFERQWSALADSFGAHGTSVASEDSRILLATALAKLERNLVAGIPEHQAQTVKHEPEIRRLIFNVTSFARIEDNHFYTLHAVLTQLLSNLISPTSGNPGADRIAEDKLALYLSGNREDDVIIRLLDSVDPKTNVATLHLINNVTRNSRPRLVQMLDGPGLRWVSKILGLMDDWHEAHDGRFELACGLINSFIDQSLQSQLFACLSSPNEPISPSQTTLLKLLDSHLSDSTSHMRSSSSVPNYMDNMEVDDPTHPNRFLIPVFHLLSAYAMTSMSHVPDDARLPKVFEGLVLVCEALSSIGLKVQGEKDLQVGDIGRGAEEGSDGDLIQEMKDPEDGTGLIKPIIESIRSLDDFAPRVNPRASANNGNSNGNGNGSMTPNRPVPPPDQARPLAQLKRNLVQLLGILSFEDIAVGDQVREHGGIQLLLSLTEVDETNPYLREHALFAVRNLMLGNPANQAIIGEMDPVGVLSETGELLPVPERMKRRGNGA